MQIKMILFLSDVDSCMSPTERCIVEIVNTREGERTDYADTSNERHQPFLFLTYIKCIGFFR